jgi:hypothetical protein
MTNIYYVYQYLREDGTPYYIGKGSKNRAYSRCRTIPRPKDKNLIEFVAINLDETEAFKLEEELIKRYGRLDNGTGILRNLTDGGEGAANTKNKIAWNKGKTQSLEHNLKISNALKGKSKSSETKKKISESKKGSSGTWTGRHHSEETKEKIRKFNLGKKLGPMSEEHKAKIAESLKKYYNK